MSLQKLVSKKGRKKKQKKMKTYLLNKCPQRKVACLKVTVMPPKKPNSASRKMAKMSFAKTKSNSFCFMPGMKHNLQSFSTVLMRGGSTKDLPGFKYKAMSGVFDLEGVSNSTKASSKYGIASLIKRAELDEADKR